MASGVGGPETDFRVERGPSFLFGGGLDPAGLSGVRSLLVDEPDGRSPSFDEFDVWSLIFDEFDAADFRLMATDFGMGRFFDL